MTDITSDTLVQAVPDLTLMVRSDGTILSRLGGRELNKLIGAHAGEAATLAQMWGTDVGQRLRLLVRSCLKGRAPLDRRIRHADRCYEVRLRPQGIDRALIVFRTLSFQDDAGQSQPIETRSQLMRKLSLAASEAQLHERPLAVVAIHLGGVADLTRILDGVVGEELVAAATHRLRKLLEPGVTQCLAPIGDDVLAAVIEDAPSRDALRALVQRIREALASPFELPARRMHINAAVGIAYAPEDSSNPLELLNRARRAMHEAQRRGSALTFHSETLRMRALSRLDGEQELRWALAGQQFRMDYRAQLALPDLRLAAVQAQPVWDHPMRGQVAAGEFLALAETSDMAQEIGRWMLATVCADMKRVQSDSALRAVVDLCRRHVLSETLVDDVLNAVSASGVNPERLAIRFTERVLTGAGELLPRLAVLRAAGVHVMLDNFGTGHTGMSGMDELPVDAVSLDAMVVRDVHNDERMRRICRSAIGIARVFGWQVTAEDVGSSDQLAWLQQLGCDRVCGELFGPASNLHQLLAASQSRGI